MAILALPLPPSLKHGSAESAGAANVVSPHGCSVLLLLGEEQTVRELPGEGTRHTAVHPHTRTELLGQSCCQHGARAEPRGDSSTELRPHLLPLSEVQEGRRCQ